MRNWLAMNNEIQLDIHRPLCYNSLSIQEAALSRARIQYLRSDIKASIPAALAAEVDLLLEDPLTKRRKYGALSKLLESLLRNWLADQKGEPRTEVPSLSDLQA